MSECRSLEVGDVIEFELQAICEVEEADCSIKLEHDIPTNEEHLDEIHGGIDIETEIVTQTIFKSEEEFRVTKKSGKKRQAADSAIKENDELQGKHRKIKEIDFATTSRSNQEKPQKSPLSNFRGPRRFLLFDSLVAEIVDYDEEDNTPIVEFSMSNNSAEADKLPVECGICPDVMHRSKLNRHVQTHIKPGTKRFKCIYCEDDFVTRAYAAGHARRHMGIRPYECEPCKVYYCTKQDLRVHQQRRHMAKEYICEQCGKTFAQNTNLNSHKMLVHEQRRRYQCDYCGKCYLRNYAKNEHVRNVHLGDRRILDCHFCDLSFRDTHKLAQHRKEAHLNQSLFECRKCGLEFTHIDFFEAHRRSIQCRKQQKRAEEQQEQEQQEQEQQGQEQQEQEQQQPQP